MTQSSWTFTPEGDWSSGHPSGQQILVLGMAVDVYADVPAGGDHLVAAPADVLQGLADQLLRDPLAAQLRRHVGVPEVQRLVPCRPVLADRLPVLHQGHVPPPRLVVLHFEVHASSSTRLSQKTGARDSKDTRDNKDKESIAFAVSSLKSLVSLLSLVLSLHRPGRRLQPDDADHSGEGEEA